MERPPVDHRILIGILIILYAVGLVGFSLESMQPLFIELVPVHLLVVTAILLYTTHPLNTRVVIILAAIGITGFFAEVAGVLTGLIFGSYSYGPALGVKLWDVPLLIGLNWVSLTLASVIIVSRLSFPVWIKALLGGSLMVFLDLWLEPLAGPLHYWYWEGGVIPIQNYIAWMFFSVLFCFTLLRFGPKLTSPIAGWWLGLQIGFFMALNGVIR